MGIHNGTTGSKVTLSLRSRRENLKLQRFNILTDSFSNSGLNPVHTCSRLMIDLIKQTMNMNRINRSAVGVHTVQDNDEKMTFLLYLYVVVTFSERENCLFYLPSTFLETKK